jgi:type I restriction enzyme R subunit
MNEPKPELSATQVQEKGPFYKKIAGGVSDTSEGGLEKIIFDDMVDRGWRAGDAKDYDRESCVDLVKLRDFLNTTQPKIAEELLLDTDNPTRRKFLARLEKEIGSRGVIDVIRRGIKVDQHDIELFYGTPSPGNAKSAELFARVV